MKRREFVGSLAAASAAAPKRFTIRPDYLGEPDVIPPFWVSSVEDVGRFLKNSVRKGRVEVFGKTAGGRPMQAVTYGTPRAGRGTTTFSGSLGFRDVRAYLGPDYARKVYLAMAAVHGGEFEGIVGMVNLISVLETGKDLRGEAWPGLQAAAAALDRLVLIPITNPDGRARIPMRMERFFGNDYTPAEYLNTGGKHDGSLLGWPQCKQFIPLDFSTVQFPGGYPNDAGVNFQHDDFFGRPQPETRALLELTGRERPDTIVSMHTGAQFLQPLKPFLEPAMLPAFDSYYRQVRARLAGEGLQASDDAARESDPSRLRVAEFNLNSALSYHCGALSIVVESPSHAFSTSKRNGQPFRHSPEQLMKAQLLCHEEGMKHLAETGGRVRWVPK